MNAPLRRRSTVALLALLFVAGACSSGGSSDGGSSDQGTADGSSSATGPASGGSASLEDLAFDESDLGEGEQFVVPADGTAVSDASPSLQFCQIDLPSEAEREARHSVQILDADYGPVAVTEAVRYPTGASASAMTELRGAFIDCPEDEPVDIGEGELVTYSAFPIDDAELGGLTSDHVGADITATAADGTETTSAIVAQRRGDVLIVVEGADHDRVVELATTAGTRLQAADGSAIGD